MDYIANRAPRTLLILDFYNESQLLLAMFTLIALFISLAYGFILFIASLALIFSTIQSVYIGSTLDLRAKILYPNSMQQPSKQQPTPPSLPTTVPNTPTQTTSRISSPPPTPCS